VLIRAQSLTCYLEKKERKKTNKQTYFAIEVIEMEMDVIKIIKIQFPCFFLLYITYLKASSIIKRFESTFIQILFFGLILIKILYTGVLNDNYLFSVYYFNFYELLFMF
jgi:hypothetical protein